MKFDGVNCNVYRTQSQSMAGVNWPEQLIRIYELRTRSPYIKTLLERGCQRTDHRLHAWAISRLRGRLGIRVLAHLNKAWHSTGRPEPRLPTDLTRSKDPEKSTLVFGATKKLMTVEHTRFQYVSKDGESPMFSAFPLLRGQEVKRDSMEERH